MLSVVRLLKLNAARFVQRNAVEQHGVVVALAATHEEVGRRRVRRSATRARTRNRAQQIADERHLSTLDPSLENVVALSPVCPIGASVRVAVTLTVSSTGATCSSMTVRGPPCQSDTAGRRLEAPDIDTSMRHPFRRAI